jgi:hypothetical protein
MDVQLDVNLDLDSIMLTIDGNQIKNWKFSNLAAGTEQGIKRLAAINFYAGCLDNLTGGTNFGTYYVDDFSVIDQQQSSSIQTSSYSNVTSWTKIPLRIRLWFQQVMFQGIKNCFCMICQEIIEIRIAAKWVNTINIEAIFSRFLFS